MRSDFQALGQIPKIPSCIKIRDIQEKRLPFNFQLAVLGEKVIAQALRVLKGSHSLSASCKSQFPTVLIVLVIVQ